MTEIMVRKYVLTGSAYSGKTTLSNALQEKGYYTVPEPARMLIETGLEGKNVLPWNDFDGFQEIILPKYLELQAQIPKDVNIVFFDRATPDEIAYFKFANKDIPEAYLRAFAEHKYDGIFLLETLPGYKQDEIRKESPEMVQRLRILHEEGYRSLGYDVVIVPVMPLEERLNFILKSIGEK